MLLIQINNVGIIMLSNITFVYNNYTDQYSYHYSILCIINYNIK